MFFAGVHRIIRGMPEKYFSLIICDVGVRDLATTDTRAFFGLGPSVGCILLGLLTGHLFLDEIVVTLLEVAAAIFGSNAPELFSQQLAILGRKNDIRDVCNVAPSLISSSELSLITIAVQRSKVLQKISQTRNWVPKEKNDSRYPKNIHFKFSRIIRVNMVRISGSNFRDN